MTDDDRALEELFRVSRYGVVHRVRHYLYFPSQESGVEAAAELTRRAFSIEQRLAADDVNWLILASHDVVPAAQALGAARELMEEQVARFCGEYDGWEAEVVSDSH